MPAADLSCRRPLGSAIPFLEAVMSDAPILLDEWHLRWTLALTADPDADGDRLHSELNAPALRTAVEHAVREAVRQTPALRPLAVSVTK